MASIAISSITIPPGRRKLDPDWVRTLADMFLVEGQQAEIEVCGTEEASTLVFGGHRLAAAELIGWKLIKAEVKTAEEIANEAQRKLREISENLIRRELSVLDKACDLAAWRDIYEATHTVAKAGRPKRATPDEISRKFATNFSEAAQRALKIGRDSVFRALKIASIAEPVRDRIALHTIADNQSELLLLAAEPRDRQERISRLITGEAEISTETVAEAIALIDRLPRPTVAPGWQKLAERFSTLKESEQDRFFELHEGAIRRWLTDRDGSAS